MSGSSMILKSSPEPVNTEAEEARLSSKDIHENHLPMQMDMSISMKYWLAMLLLAMAISFSFQGARGLYETTEGRYAECAREMVETRNYLEPTVGYEPLWTKPPLTYWAIAAGMNLLGPNEWGVRCYNAIAFILTVLAVAYLGATLWGAKTGVVAGFIYASSPLPVFGAYAVTADNLLTLWEVLAVLCYVKARHARLPRKQNNWILGMWISFGLGFLTKGPAALIPLVPIILWQFWRKGEVTLGNPVGFALFILIGFFWYLIVCIRHPELASYFLGCQVLDRVASNSFHNPQWYKPFTIYLPLLTLGALPWLYFGTKMLWQKGVGSPKRLWSYLALGNDSAFLWLWFFLPLTILFLVRSRLSLYVLPLYAPLALAMARGICRDTDGFRIVRKVAMVAFFAAVFFIGAKGVMAFRPDKRNMKPVYETCRRLGSNGREFLLFTESDTWTLYGLQFYLKGNLKRITPSGKETWADECEENALQKIVNRHLFKSLMLISNKRHGADLAKILGASNVRYKLITSRYWTALCLEEDGIDGAKQSLLSSQLWGWPCVSGCGPDM